MSWALTIQIAARAARVSGRPNFLTQGAVCGDTVYSGKNFDNTCASGQCSTGKFASILVNHGQRVMEIIRTATEAMTAVR